MGKMERRGEHVHASRRRVGKIRMSVVMSVERVTSPAARMAWQRVSTAFS